MNEKQDNTRVVLPKEELVIQKPVRNSIKVTPEQLYHLCTENGLIPTGKTEFEKWDCVYDEYESGSRHTEHWYIVLQAPDGNYYGTIYEKSVKDSMGWEECNRHHDCILTQVFPKTITTIIYE